ncbi:MAG TPA: ATP-binding protein [Hyphomicrobiaceae bacterium]|nr:ATP-binding protein [Hyphomicrobiaceae bacterium]
MLQTVYAMCGLAFSGKSSLAAILARELKTELISLDAINHERGLRGGDGMSDRQWEETSATAMARLRLLLRHRCSVVVDDTFSHRFLRDRCKQVAADHGSRFLIIFMATPLSEIEARRAANDRDPVRHRMRDEVFRQHRDRFQFPGDDEPVVRIRKASDVEDLLLRERHA